MVTSLGPVTPLVDCFDPLNCDLFHPSESIPAGMTPCPMVPPCDELHPLPARVRGW